MGENTRYIHIRHSKTFPRQSYRMRTRLPVPRAVFPACLSFRHRRPPSRLAVPIGRKDRVHDQAADRAPDRSVDRCIPFVPFHVPCLSLLTRPVYLIRSSHLSISSVCRASARLVSLSRHPAVRLSLVPSYRQARRGVMSPSVSPYCRRISVVSSCEMSWNVVRCKGRGYHLISQNVMFGKQ